MKYENQLPFQFEAPVQPYDPDVIPPGTCIQVAAFSGYNRVVVLEFIKHFNLQLVQKEFSEAICFMGFGAYFAPFISDGIACECSPPGNIEETIEMVVHRRRVKGFCDMRQMVEALRKG